MTAAAPQAVPLDRAVLCEDCRQITAAQNGHCPVCGSAALASLANFLEARERQSCAQTKLAGAA